MKLLQVDSSILGDHSATRSLTAAIVTARRKRQPDLEVEHLDLAQAPLPHFTGADLGAAADPRNAELLAQFLAADVVVVGAPMYNFTVPSQLKAWIDRILVAGRTFRYTAEGPVGLAGGKQVVLALGRGGLYPDGAPGEHLESYLRHVFRFIGIEDIAVVRADGLAISPEHRQRALAAARAAVDAPLARVA